jgi:glutathione synthase
MRIGVQMDPLDRIQVEGDTSFALMLEAQRRGFEVWWFPPEDLFFEEGVLRAEARQVKLADTPGGGHFIELERETLEIGHFDVVLVRQDPPFDIAYVANTYLLQLAQGETLVVNNPAGIRNISEKLATLAFEDLIAKTFVGRNLAAMEAFVQRFPEVVVKPAFLNGGEGVVRLTRDQPDLRGRLEGLLAQVGKEPLVVQEFLPAVVRGDIRVMMLDGEIVGALRRVPKAGDFRANIHVGGRAEAAELSPQERAVAERVGPLLRAEGIVFAGLDLIDGRLTEINVTSPTLVRELQRLTGVDVAALFWDRVAARFAASPAAAEA